MDKLRELEKYCEDEQFVSKWEKIKQINKQKLKEWVLQKTNIEINVNTMFDVQIKRIHEYKRQFMNILYVIHRYLELKKMSPE